MKVSREKLNRGGILAVTLILGLSGISFVLGFYGWSLNKSYYYNRRVAKVKAFYNAETGMARRAYDYLWSTDFIEGYEGINGESIDKNMGFYLKPGFSYNDSGERVAGVYGIHNLRNGSGSIYRCSAFVQLPATPQTLASYMYLTESENAGGAPFTFDNINTRRQVTFGVNDKLEGIVQTNGQLVVSDFGCPDFSDAEVFLTNSTPIDLGNCGTYQNLFGGWGSEIDTASKPPVKLPPTGYETLKRVATHVIEADMKITGSKDTLIMTDILFDKNGGYQVKQWWYLVPPHLKSDANLSGPTADDLDLDGFGQCTDFICNEFEDNDDLRSTNAYLDFLASYHGKYRSGAPFYSDRFLIYSNYTRPTTGPHGLHHFDIDQVPESNFGPPPPNLISNQNFSNSGRDNVIYVKGGPVRVRGFYKGRYTIVTDEYTTYKRHAWPDNSAPIDTVWNNIWLTGDLVNADAEDRSDTSNGLQNISDGNMRDLQPDSDCEGGSENSMGLVSGANIIIANTHDNGAKNRGNQGNIIINSALLALNESFVMHYSQNSTNTGVGYIGALDDIGGNQSSHQSPWGDGRGDDVNEFGQTTTGINDNRGYVYLWGGVVQKYRGYMKRNPTSPYGNASIGMDKSYHYDSNLDCNPPPFYPAIEFDDGSGEIQIKMSGYNSVL